MRTAPSAASPGPSSSSRVDLPLERIKFLKERIRLTEVMDHFGHRYRHRGNMICPFHDERRPSSRLYADQDTFWCWVCSPDHGVDQLEYVILQLGLEADVDPRNQLPKRTRHSLATLRAILYLEGAFGISYESQPWEQQLARALYQAAPDPDPGRDYRTHHAGILRLMAQVKDPAKWSIYSQEMYLINQLRSAPDPKLAERWVSLRLRLAGLKN